jgi:diguanylate cyclase (GGDEF)-like protein
LQLTIARHANPLSGLPGNVPLNEHIQQAIQQKRHATVCYFDLDNFKPYNDTYGYNKGDKVINKTAKILSQHIDHEIDFLGHVGGDDFIVIFDSQDWRSRCKKMLSAFESLYVELYTAEHLQQGGIHAQDRHGHQLFYPLLSLSIGAVTISDFDYLRDETDLAEHATKAKSKAKKISGNSLYQLKLSDCQPLAQVS